MPPPPPMNLYRARPLEVQAFDLGDGRYVVLDDSPRYVASVEFEAAFELVEERRTTVTRRRANGKKKPPKVEKRKSAGRRKENGDEAKVLGGPRVEARKLWDHGKEAPAIAKAVKTKVGNIYYWKNADKWPKHSPAPAASRQASRAQTAAGHKGGPPEDANHDGDWMK